VRRLLSRFHYVWRIYARRLEKAIRNQTLLSGSDAATLSLKTQWRINS
jgi:hypothetical protein